MIQFFHHNDKQAHVMMWSLCGWLIGANGFLYFGAFISLIFGSMDVVISESAEKHISY